MSTTDEERKRNGEHGSALTQLEYFIARYMAEVKEKTGKDTVYNADHLWEKVEEETGLDQVKLDKLLRPVPFEQVVAVLPSETRNNIRRYLRGFNSRYVTARHALEQLASNPNSVPEQKLVAEMGSRIFNKTHVLRLDYFEQDDGVSLCNMDEPGWRMVYKDNPSYTFVGQTLTAAFILTEAYSRYRKPIAHGDTNFLFDSAWNEAVRKEVTAYLKALPPKITPDVWKQYERMGEQYGIPTMNFNHNGVLAREIAKQHTMHKEKENQR
ncbi:MAG: hypothetical protein V1725_07260 [archaeon]